MTVLFLTGFHPMEKRFLLENLHFSIRKTLKNKMLSEIFGLRLLNKVRYKQQSYNL